MCNEKWVLLHLCLSFSVCIHATDVWSRYSFWVMTSWHAHSLSTDVSITTDCILTIHLLQTVIKLILNAYFGFIHKIWTCLIDFNICDPKWCLKCPRNFQPPPWLSLLPAFCKASSKSIKVTKSGLFDVVRHCWNDLTKGIWEEFWNVHLLMTWVWLSWGDPVWLTGH